MNCEGTHCRNNAKFSVSDFRAVQTEDKAVAVCGLHLQWGMRQVLKEFPLFLVGLLYTEETL